MDPSIEIRNYTPADNPFLIQLLKLNVPRYFAASEIEDYTRYLNQEVEKYFVVVWHDTLIGAGGINYKNGNQTAMISWDFIHPEFQRKGIGGKLLAHRMNLLFLESQVTEIRVRTSQFVFKFYQKHGFVLFRTVKDYWASGYDLYEMQYPMNNERKEELIKINSATIS